MRRTKRVARHKSNDSKGLKGVNIGLTYVLVGRRGKIREGKNDLEKWPDVDRIKGVTWEAENFNFSSQNIFTFTGS